MAPIYAAGAISKLEIDRIEAEVKRKWNLLPNDIKSKLINSVVDHFVQPTCGVISLLALKQRNYVSRDKRIETKQAKGDLNKPTSEQIEAEKEIKDKTIRNTKNSIIDKEMRMLMLSVSA